MRQSSIAFDTKVLTLEGVVASPVGASGSLPGVVVCHPHPLFGGSMDNPLVLGVCQALVDEDFVALRFNFRGVGKSEGSFTGGEKEPEDVRAALGLLEQWPGVNRRAPGAGGVLLWGIDGANGPCQLQDRQGLRHHLATAGLTGPLRARQG